MKKLKDLKENECIKISTKREAKRLAKQLNKQGFTKRNLSKFTSNWLFDSKYTYLSKSLGSFDLYVDPNETVYPASDFIRPSVKERLRILEEQLPQVINNGEGRFTVKIPANYLESLSVVDAETVLSEMPEKWAVKHSPETLKWIRENAEINGSEIEQDAYYWFPKDAEGNNAGICFDSDYTEITFAQFEKWMLNSKTKLEDGKWYIYTDGAIMFNVSEGKRFGINTFKTWCNDAHWLRHHDSNGTDFRLATHAEVEAALIGEAKRRYKEGTTIHSPNAECNAVLKNFSRYKYENEINRLLYFYDAVMAIPVFDNGIWAEVIEQPSSIDWSVPGQLVECALQGRHIILLTSGEHIDISFTATVINHVELKQNPVGKIADNWGKEYFKPYTGEPITLSNGK